MNFISKLWLKSRQDAVRETVKNHGLCLDIGCGEYPIYPSVITLDIDESKNPNYVADASKQLPFDNSSFDVVFCLETVEHLENHPKFYSEVSRILRPNGQLVITSPSSSFVWKFVWYLWGRTFGRVWLGTHKKDFNIDEMKEEFNVTLQKRVNLWLDLVVGEKK